MYFLNCDLLHCRLCLCIFGVCFPISLEYLKEALTYATQLSPSPTLAFFSIWFTPKVLSCSPSLPPAPLPSCGMNSVTQLFQWNSYMYVMLFELYKIGLNFYKILFQILLILIQEILTKNIFLMRKHYYRSKQSLCRLGLCVFPRNRKY